MILAQANPWLDVTNWAAWVVLAFLAGLELLILWKIYDNKIDLSQLISEPGGSASMSRFQLLIFTFVIAASLFLIIVQSKQFPQIPQNVLVLLGISASSYLVSKGIQYSAPDDVAVKGKGPNPPPPAARP